MPESKTLSILVTGATGNIGRELTKQLSARKVPFRAMVRSSRGAEAGLPVVEKMISQDLTDDEDPAIGDKIREIHRSRFENDPALLSLIKDLGSYKGSGVPDDGATSA